MSLLDRLRRAAPPPAPESRQPPPRQVAWAGLGPFVFAEHVEHENGFPYLDWNAVYAWTQALPEAERGAAWVAVADAWDGHLCAALGPQYRVERGAGALVISSLEPRLARQAVDFMQKTQRRILGALEGIAVAAEYGNELLVVLDDEDTYYRYIARFYPESGSFALSGGIKIDDGSVYYATAKGHLRDIEPVIAHEMTHGCVGHLPLPRWLDEGIAVNMEESLTGRRSAAETPEALRAKHLAFWNAQTVQEFWAGHAHRRADDGNALSYDLGRVLVEHLGADWPRFRAFANAAHWRDGGAAAAREHLGAGLGSLVAAFLERPGEDFEPRPETWAPAEAAPPARTHFNRFD